MSHTLSILLVLGAGLAAAARAQGDTTFVPGPHLGRWQIENVPALLAQLPSTRLGKLLADEEVAHAFATAVKRHRADAARFRALVAAARARAVELDPWLQAQLYREDPLAPLHEVELEELQRVELVALRPGEDARAPETLVVFGCTPRAEGRWARLLEDHARRLEHDASWRRDADAKFGGFPVHAFRAARELTDEQAERSGLDLPRIWMLHLPGTFAAGTGDIAKAGELATPPSRPDQTALGEFDLEAYGEMFTRGGVAAELDAIGFAALKALRWRGRFVGELLLDEIELETDGEPKGLVGALLTGAASTGNGTPPAQPLPDGALAQLRATIDVAAVLDAIGRLAGSRALPADVADAMRAAFPGGVAIGVAAPVGGVIPRVYVSLEVGDRDALTTVIDAIARNRMPRTEVTYEGVPCTVLTVADMPQGLQPAWCVVDGVLHVAESGPSLRALLKARGNGLDAMDVGDAPVPAGPGELAGGVDLRWDGGALYRAFHRHWLPLLQLLPGDQLQHALLRGDEMPDPDAVAPLLGKGRGVLRRNGGTWTLQQLGALGGLETTALAITYGPLLSALMRQDWTTRQLEHAVGAAQLAAVWTELEAFREQHQRWPQDLAELFAATKLPDDALLLPGDTDAEPVALPGGTRTITTSFRYFAAPVEVDTNGESYRLLLVAIEPRSAFRPMLTDTGVVPQTWGEVNQRSIDGFGR